MNFRDLTDSQALTLQKACESTLTQRNKGRRQDNQINPIDFKLGFSDGVRIILARLPYLPDDETK